MGRMNNAPSFSCWPNSPKTMILCDRGATEMNTKITPRPKFLKSRASNLKIICDNNGIIDETLDQSLCQISAKHIEKIYSPSPDASQHRRTVSSRQSNRVTEIEYLNDVNPGLFETSHKIKSAEYADRRSFPEPSNVYAKRTSFHVNGGSSSSLRPKTLSCHLEQTHDHELADFDPTRRHEQGFEFVLLGSSHSTQSGHSWISRKPVLSRPGSPEASPAIVRNWGNGGSLAYPCKHPGCGKVFGFSFDLVRHEQVHSLNPLEAKKFKPKLRTCDRATTPTALHLKPL